MLSDNVIKKYDWKMKTSLLELNIYSYDDMFLPHIFIRSYEIILKMITEFVDVNYHRRRQTLSANCLGAFKSRIYVKICFVITIMIFCYILQTWTFFFQ